MYGPVSPRRDISPGTTGTHIKTSTQGRVVCNYTTVLYKYVNVTKCVLVVALVQENVYMLQVTTEVTCVNPLTDSHVLLMEFQNLLQRVLLAGQVLIGFEMLPVQGFIIITNFSCFEIKQHTHL